MIDHLRYTMRAMQLFSRAQEVTANNLANLNTPGFKKDKMYQRSFDEMLYGDGAREVEQYQITNLASGTLEQTGNVFDVALQGDGFFEVEAGNRKLLTRNGQFHLDKQGILRNEQGHAVQGLSGSIMVPDSLLTGKLEQQEQKIEIGRDGVIRVNDTVIDQLKIVKVKDTTKLERLADSFFGLEDRDLLEIDQATLVNQGYLEKGNANPLEEMLAMQKNMRLFESSQRNMRSTDEIIAEVTTRLGRF
jgi:flagellar basal body rod protein FlgG